MRLEKEVKIEREDNVTLTFYVYEVRPRDLMALLPSDAEGQDEPLLTSIEKALPLCSTIKMTELEALYPSEIETLLNAFKVVNRPFLEMAGTLGLGPILEEARRSLVSDLLDTATSLLPPAMSTVSTTAGAGSSAQ